MHEEHTHDAHASAHAEGKVGEMVIRLTPVQMFLTGLAGGVLVLCTVGFFILLGMTLSGDGGGKKIAVNPTPTAVGGEEEPAAAPEIRPVTDEDHIRGNKNAKVTIVEYTDLECPFCKRFHATTQEIMKKYGDDVRLVIRHFPLDQLHAQARQEALATECAAEQGKFWELVDIIFEKTTSNDGLDLAKLPDYAKQAGVKDISKFNKCVADQKYADRVQADEQDAQAAGARGTPYSIVLGPDGQAIPVNGAQPLAAVSATIDQLLK